MLLSVLAYLYLMIVMVMVMTMMMTVSCFEYMALDAGARLCQTDAATKNINLVKNTANGISLKGAGASEAGGQTKEGPLSKRYFQTSKIAQNRTKSPVPIVIDVFGVTAPYGNPYGSKIAIVWLFFVIF